MLVKIGGIGRKGLSPLNIPLIPQKTDCVLVV